MTNRGLYIVIEGPQGVGKTTQVELLAAKLREQGRMVRIAREPDSQTELTARAIRLLTQDPRYPMNTKTEVLLYNAARSQSLEVVRLTNQAGIDCIVDRSFLTNLAVQYYGRADIKDYETIDRIIRFAVGDMYPDVMLILDAPVDTLLERFKKRYHGERFDNLDKPFLERVRNGYLTEATNRAIPVLDALKPPEVLADEILTHITYAREAAVDRPLKDSGEAAFVSAKSIEVAKVELSQFASFLAVSKSEFSGLTSLTDKTKYYRPENFGKKVLGAYDIIVKKLLENYMVAVTDLSKHLATKALRMQKPFKVAKLKSQALGICQNLLPTCTLVSFQAKSGVSQQLEETNQTSQSESFVSSLLPNIDAEQPKLGVRLLAHTPHNEFDVLESIIFEETDHGTTAVKKLTDELKYDQKYQILKKITDLSTNSAPLRNVLYTLEIVSEFSQFLGLLAMTNYDSVSAQKLTPRYGFETPALIEEAGLSELFQQSFDLSLELYSLLQAAGFENQAEYACLLGHKIRYKISITFPELKKVLIKQKMPLHLKPLLSSIKQQAKDVHPLLWEDI